MAGVVEWVKSYSLVFLFMTVLTTAVAKKEYQKYIQIFVEIILVLTLLDPLLELTGRSEDLFEKISYDSFFQGLEEMKKDQEKMDFMDKEAYISYYEKALKEDVALLAESMGYVVTDASVSLNEAYEVEKIEVSVAKAQVETVIIGSVEEQPQKAEITALKERIRDYYRVEEDKIIVRD